MKETRWGIVGTGKICNDFVTAVSKTYDESTHRFVAVASRSLRSADEFAAKFNIPKAYEGYDCLCKNSDVEVVYIGTINPTHFSIVKSMLNAGKHVLCEKPLGMNVSETREMIRLAESRGLFLMEGIWSRFLPSYDRLRNELTNESIGTVLYMTASFGIQSESERIRKKELGGGSILDLGVYCVQLANMVFNKDKPLKIAAVGHLNSEETDDSASAVLKYSENRTANLICHASVSLKNEAVIYGTEGKITLEFPFWCANKITTPSSGTIEFPFNETANQAQYNFIHSAGLSFEAQHVRECLSEGLIESPLLDHDDMEQISWIMENIRMQVGVVYRQDQEQ